MILYLIGVDESLKMITLQAIIWGVLFTLFLKFLFPWFMKKLLGKRIDNIIPELLKNEKVEEEIGASLFRGIEGVGGKMFFTNQRLIFKSHSLNIQKGQTNIDFSEIKNIEKRKTIKIVDNGIKVTTKEGKEYCFVVSDRDIQIQKIKNKLVE
ncbi:GRAM domain-containing protein [Polaribacter sp.]|uniref:GRAM domain-containing protein n=1 Tax=Polaribacter sp. TaxID=1920175 RepID=UPI003F4B5F76